MRTLTDIKNPTINLLGQDCRDIVLICAHFGASNVVQLKQDKGHSPKEYTVRVCNAMGTQPYALRDVWVEIDARENVIECATARII